MLIPVLVFFACFGAAITASARWLPELGPGPVGGLAFFAVCGLLAAAAALGGLHVYSTIRDIHELGGAQRVGGESESPEILANGMRSILFDSGTLIGLAGIVYLLAPPGDDDQPVSESASIDVATAD